MQTFVGDKVDDGVRRAAEKAVKTMRDAKRLPVELSEVRSELTELQELHEELAEEFAAFKDRLDAMGEGESVEEGDLDADAGEDVGDEDAGAGDTVPDGEGSGTPPVQD